MWVAGLCASVQRGTYTAGASAVGTSTAGSAFGVGIAESFMEMSVLPEGATHYIPGP